MISLDGYFEGPNHDLSWHGPVVDAEFNEYAAQMLDSIDTQLMGRRIYHTMATYWPKPAARTDDPIIAKKMNEMQKVVFSKSLKKVDWENSRLVKTDAIKEIRRLKAMPGKDMSIGGSDFALSAIQAGLVDELRIFVNPVFIGKGRPLFDGIKERLRLKLVKTKTFKSGLILLYYVPEK